jgi:hypothetical protein
MLLVEDLQQELPNYSYLELRLLSIIRLLLSLDVDFLFSPNVVLASHFLGLLLLNSFQGFLGGSSSCIPIESLDLNLRVWLGDFFFICAMKTPRVNCRTVEVLFFCLLLPKSNSTCNPYRGHEVFERLHI